MKQLGGDISELALRSFVRTYGLIRGRMEPYFARFGISVSQWSILRALQRAQNEGLAALRPTELGERLLVKPPSVTTLVDRLERMGLVDRAAAGDDQRAKHVRLTPAGRQLVARVLERHPAQIRAVLAGLTDAECRELHHLVEKLAAHLESLEDVQLGRRERRRAGIRVPTEGVNR